MYQDYVMNLVKDIKVGKRQLKSTVLGRHKANINQHYLTFAKPNKKEKDIILLVDKSHYLRYRDGKKVLIMYLRYSKKILSIDEL